MTWSVIFAVGAILSLLPLGLVSRAATAMPAAGGMPQPWAVRLALAMAVLGPIAWVIAQQVGGWRTGLGAALWLAVATTITLFAGLTAITPTARRLAPMLVVYLALLGALAAVWQQVPGRPLRSAAIPPWLLVHIAVALLGYGLLTLAAVAGGGVVVQERALRLKRPTRFSRSLPAVADGERLQTRLLVAVEALLGITLLSGIVVNRAEGQGWLTLDHKTVLSILAFVLIGCLLLLHLRFGLSGRRGARYGLLAYLLLTLAYPGVKLVTDVILARGG